MKAETDYYVAKLTQDPTVREPFHLWLRRRFPNMVWDKPHHLLIFDALQRLTDGDINKLMIFLPPRHGKSQCVTVRYTAWLLEQIPELNAIVAAYNLTLAAMFSRQIRRIATESGVVSEERKAVDDWDTIGGGHVRAAGVGSGITGMGGEWIVIDDPIRGREEADSLTYRDRTWEWYQDDLYTRRNPRAKMCIIQTRWHLDDLSGRILNSEDADNWTVIHIPALAMENDPLGREPGEALWPERVPASELEAIKQTNERGFWALYQGMPQPDGGAIFLSDWWDRQNRYDISDKAQKNLAVGRYQFWDTAEETGENNAFTSCVTLDVMPDGLVHVRDVYRERLMFPELLDAVTEQARKHNRDEKLNNIVIEYASSGRGLYQMLQVAADRWVVDLLAPPYKPKSSKEERANQISHWCRNGFVKLPYPNENAPWLHNFEKELFTFPQSLFKDQVDAFVMGLHWLEYNLQQALEARGVVA